MGTFFVRFNTTITVASAENVVTIGLYRDLGRMKMVDVMEKESLYNSE